MFKKIEFFKAVFNSSGFPREILPELALCGRSNVGKSSFINSLFNRKNIAKTSSSPGKTRSINYYLVENKFYLVDLPGFGYAGVSKEERNRWDKMINNYFRSSRDINLVIHFIDSRHKPTTTDIQLNKYLKELDFPGIVVLNKIDKLKQSELAFAKKEICRFFPELIFGENLLLYSAVKGTGRNDIQKKIISIF